MLGISNSLDMVSIELNDNICRSRPNSSFLSTCVSELENFVPFRKASHYWKVVTDTFGSTFVIQNFMLGSERSMGYVVKTCCSFKATDHSFASYGMNSVSR